MGGEARTSRSRGASGSISLTSLSWWLKLGTRVEELLVRGRITKDRERVKEEFGNNRLGASYWRSLAQLYSAGVEGVQAMKVQDPSLPVQDALIQWLEAACRPNPATRTMEPLVVFMFLQHIQPLNEKELIGLFKALDGRKNMGKANSDLAMVAVTKYLCRAKQTETFSNEVATMKASSDEALTTHSASAPAHAVTHSSNNHNDSNNGQ